MQLWNKGELREWLQILRNPNELIAARELRKNR